MSLISKYIYFTFKITQIGSYVSFKMSEEILVYLPD